MQGWLAIGGAGPNSVHRHPRRDDLPAATPAVLTGVPASRKARPAVWLNVLPSPGGVLRIAVAVSSALMSRPHAYMGVSQGRDRRPAPGQAYPGACDQLRPTGRRTALA